MKKKISLVLGSGGARGLAHIGVIRWLEENDYSIESISGSSIGALIGGVYAAGKLNEFEEWLKALTRFDILKLLDISWNKSGFIKGDRIINELIKLVGDCKIEELPLRYTAVATDLKTEKEIWIYSGPLFDAIRASISLPMFFTPHKHQGVYLIDGGVVNPVPIAPTLGDKTDITIAVDLGGRPQGTGKNQPVKKNKKTANENLMLENIEKFINQFTKNEEMPKEHNWGLNEVANQAIDVMQAIIARHKLAAYSPDYVIEIPRDCCGVLEFERGSEIIQLGYRTAKDTLAKNRKTDNESLL